ncbi:MAG: hypothetical protein M3042_00105 [Actinomycetota bacterium]|nr:hypothetical protein [Actinomycetota bacterium]
MHTAALRRGARWVLAAMTLAAIPSGCGTAGQTLAHRYVVVVFVPDPAPSDVGRVRAKCDRVGGARALPPGPKTATNRRYPLRFDVSGLSLPARSKLVACLSADPSVRGYEDSESTAGF